MQRLQNSSGLCACPCCGYATLSGEADFEICSICFWEDDGQDDPNADEAVGGPNKVSLTQGRLNFLEIGASDLKDLQYCRSPDGSDVLLRTFVDCGSSVAESKKA